MGQVPVVSLQGGPQAKLLLVMVIPRMRLMTQPTSSPSSFLSITSQPSSGPAHYSQLWALNDQSTGAFLNWHMVYSAVWAFSSSQGPEPRSLFFVGLDEDKVVESSYSRVQIPVLPLAGCVTLQKSPNLSGLLFLHLYKQDKNVQPEAAVRIK